MRRYQEPVYRVAWLILRDSDLAEAATLSTFVRAYRALPSYTEEVGLMPWLLRIAAGESRQQRRGSGRARNTDRPPERRASPAIPTTPILGLAEAYALTPVERLAVTEAFDRLGEDDRLIIAARYLFGLTRSEAANALSIAAGVVDENLGSAMSRLRARMGTP